MGFFISSLSIKIVALTLRDLKSFNVYEQNQ